MNPAAAKAGWSVVPEESVREFNGSPCIEFNDDLPAGERVALVAVVFDAFDVCARYDLPEQGGLDALAG